jgi:hypothetical protein
MDWLPLLSTFGGATIALSGTFLLESRKQREARSQDYAAEKRVKYLQFIAALHSLHSNLRQCAESAGNEIELSQATSDAVRDSHIYEAREGMLVTAGRDVARMAEDAFAKTMAIQPVIRAGFAIKSPEYHNAYHDYAEALWRLRMEIRADLGIAPLRPADLGQLSWSEREDCTFCNESPATDN